MFALPDGKVAWSAPVEEVTNYLVRVFYLNSRGKRAGIETDIIGPKQAWLQVSESFPKLIQGVQYYFQVCANAVGIQKISRV